MYNLDVSIILCILLFQIQRFLSLYVENTVLSCKLLKGLSLWLDYLPNPTSIYYSKSKSFLLKRPLNYYLIPSPELIMDRIMSITWLYIKLCIDVNVYLSVRQISISLNNRRWLYESRHRKSLIMFYKWTYNGIEPLIKYVSLLYFTPGRGIVTKIFPLWIPHT